MARAGGCWFLSPAWGSFCTAWLVWRASTSLHGRADLAIGAAFGVLTSLLAHHATWYVAMLSMWFCAIFTDHCRSSLGEYPVNPLYALVGAGVYAMWSLYLAGLITVPAGAIIGAVCVRWPLNRHD